MAAKTLLQVKGLKKHFPIYGGVFRHQVGSVKAVDGIDFAIDEGEVLGMVGESGCGKSTAGRTAMRLLEPTEGEISYRDRNFLALSEGELREVRQEIQMVFQDPFSSLNPRKSIGESIGEPLLYHGIVKNRAAQAERVEEILSLIGLSPDVQNRYPHEFSGGQQQRICIGRAVAMHPKLIICDEAVSALDVSIQAQVLNLLHELKEKLNLSYLFISHDLSVVRHICDRLVVLYLGKVMETGRVEEIFENPRHPYTQALLSSVPKEHPKEKRKQILLEGEIPSPIDPPKGCPFHTRCPVSKAECALAPPPKKTVATSSGITHEYFCIY